MRMEEIRERGRALGVAGSRMRKAEMIRAIQSKEGNPACYGAPWRFECPQLQCCWRSDCMVTAPG
jgi:hypothetical protein